MKHFVKSLLETVHLLKILARLKRDIEYHLGHFAYGIRVSLKRFVFGDYKSPMVQENLSCLATIRSEISDIEHLNFTNPKLNSLYERYESKTPYLEITSPLWHESPRHIDLLNFRSHSRYIWTYESAFRYKMTAQYVSKLDVLGLLRLFGEDDAFGCKTIEWRGIQVSRDKLDSIMEIYYLMTRLGIGVFDTLKVLDIGAGYGRLAHRFTTLFRKSEFYCVDAIPISTFLCEFYLRFRKVKNAYVIPFDNVEILGQHDFDFAINVHSFPEQTRRSIELWMNLLDSANIKRLIIIDHNGRWLTMEPPDNWRSSYFPILEKHGWALIDARPKYGTVVGNLFGIYPETVYSFFVRN